MASHDGHPPRFRQAKRAKNHAYEDEDEYQSSEVSQDASDFSDSGSPSKAPKSNSSPSKPRTKGGSRSLPGAGPWNPKFTLRPGKIAKHKNRKDLNITAGYGKLEYWPPGAGLRELVQNMFDGSLGYLRKMDGKGHCTARDIEARLVCSPNSGVAPQHSGKINLKSVPRGETVTYELHYKPPVDASPSKKRKKEEPALGWVSFKAAKGGYYEQYTADIELYNGGDTIDFDCMTFGYSSKVGENAFIGQHGDGMKMVYPSLSTAKAR